jgi:hypothetical protein
MRIPALGGCVLVVLASAGCAGTRLVPDASKTGQVERRRPLAAPAVAAPLRSVQLRDRRHRRRVDAAIAGVPGFPEVSRGAVWVPAHSTEPGTYVGTSSPDDVVAFFRRSQSFVEGRPTAGHRERVGRDAVEFRQRTDVIRWNSLHFVVSPTTGRFELHIDQFNPYDSPLHSLLHWLIEVLPG